MATACFSQALPLILVLLLSTDAVSVLPAPANVSVSSFNLQQILQWDPVKVENVTYMVEYREWYEGDNDYLALCKKTTQTECNFTALVPFNWRIILRVRAEVGNLSSRWRETPKFQATRNTTLGPVKSLKLLPREAVHDAISVSFEPPISREILPHGSVMKFTLHYWKNSSGKENGLFLATFQLKKIKTNFKWSQDITICNMLKGCIKKEISSTNTPILLKDLDPMSVYCVKVTASVWNLVGEPSETVCEKSAAPALTATGYIWLVVGLVCACCVMSVCALALYKHHKMIKKLLPPPPLTIPYHVEKFLQDTSFQYLKGDQCEIEEHYDHISIVEHGSGYDRKDSCNEEWDLKQMPDEKSFYQTIS